MALHFRTSLVPLALALAASVAHADPLTPGGVVVAPAGASAVTNPLLVGAVVEDVVTPFAYQGWYMDDSTGNPVSTHGLVEGAVEAKVIRTNAGTFDFYWRVTTFRNSFLPVESLYLSGFAPGSFEANWRTDGPAGVVPALAQEDVSGQIKWAFGQYLPPSAEIYPGQTSVEFFLSTSATGYTHGATYSLQSARDDGGNVFLDWGGRSREFTAFAPLPAVPEPGTAALLLAGVTGVAGVLRRRRPQA
jgi:hypothetical protein